MQFGVDRCGAEHSSQGLDALRSIRIIRFGHTVMEVRL